MSPARARALGAAAVALAVAAVLASALAAPTARVAGSPSVDGYGTQWFFWFAGEVAAGRQSVTHTELLFHPWGKDIYAHTGGNLVDAWLAWPLRVALGPVLGFNLWIVLLLGTNAWAGARLAAAFGVPAGARWSAALALVLNPYVLAEIDLGRPTQAWLAPAGLALAGLARMRGARAGAGAGVLLALTALTYWYYGLMLAVAAGLVGLARVALGPERRGVIVANVLAAGVSCALALPFALPMREALASGAVPGLLAVDGTGLAAPLALRTVEGDEQGLYVVSVLGAAAGSLVDDGGLRFNPGLPALFGAHLVVAALGAAALARGGASGAPRAGAADEAGGALRGGPPRPPMNAARIWVPVLLALSLFVASGPVLVLGEVLMANRPWSRVVAEVDVLRRWWWPGRAVFLAHLVVAPLVPILLARLGSRAARWGAGALLLASVLVSLRREALLPMASWDAAIPASLACLARAPTGAVVDVPLLVDQKNLWFQTVHRHPVLGGMLLKKPAFAPTAFTVFREQDPLARALDAIGGRQYLRDIGPATAEERAAFAAGGYRYVLARIDAFGRTRVDARGGRTWVSDWSRPRRQLVALLGAPAFEDEALALWTVDGSPVDCDGATARVTPRGDPGAEPPQSDRTR